MIGHFCEVVVWAYTYKSNLSARPPDTDLIYFAFGNYTTLGYGDVLPVPQWHHHQLLLDETGDKLAKRRGSPSLADHRKSGEDGRALAEKLRCGNLPAGISLSTY